MDRAVSARTLAASTMLVLAAVSAAAMTTFAVAAIGASADKSALDDVSAASPC